MYDHLARDLDADGLERLEANLHDEPNDSDEPEVGSWDDPVTVDLDDLDEQQQAWLREAGVLT